MKTLGKIFLGLIILAALGLGYAFWQSGIVSKETKVYLDAALPPIIATWDVEELWKRASPELASSVKKEEIAALFSKFNKHLGKFVSYDGVTSSGHFSINYTPGSGKVETAVCAAQAQFANGPAEIRVTLIKHGDAWEFLRFDLNSKAFLD